MDNEQIDVRAAWVERHIGRTLTDFQRRAVVLMCRAMRRGPYDFPRTFETADWEAGRGIRFSVRRPQMSTYDTEGLTDLVIGAHDEAIRVEIDARSFTNIEITMHPRQREHDSQWGRHPTIEQAVARYRGNLHAGRTPTDYALEHAEYLAKAAERLIEAMDEAHIANEAALDLSEKVATTEQYAIAESRQEQANEDLRESIRAIQNRVYEFRKRRDRAQGAATEAVQKHLKSAP